MSSKSAAFAVLAAMLAAIVFVSQSVGVSAAGMPKYQYFAYNEGEACTFWWECKKGMKCANGVCAPKSNFAADRQLLDATPTCADLKNKFSVDKGYSKDDEEYQDNRLALCEQCAKLFPNSKEAPNSWVPSVKGFNLISAYKSCSSAGATPYYVTKLKGEDNVHSHPSNEWISRGGFGERACTPWPFRRASKSEEWNPNWGDKDRTITFTADKYNELSVCELATGGGGFHIVRTSDFNHPDGSPKGTPSTKFVIPE